MPCPPFTLSRIPTGRLGGDTGDKLSYQKVTPFLQSNMWVAKPTIPETLKTVDVKAAFYSFDFKKVVGFVVTIQYLNYFITLHNKNISFLREALKEHLKGSGALKW